MVIPDAEISAVRFIAVCCGCTIHPRANVSEEVNRKCRPRNTIIQFSAPYTPHLWTIQCTASQTDGHTDDNMNANSRSYKKAVLSQGERRDAGVNFNTYRILQRHHTVSLPQHGFLVILLVFVCRLACTADNAGLLSKVSEEVATEIAKRCLRQSHYHLTPPPWGTPMNICTYLILLSRN